MDARAPHRIVVVGGGFAGLNVSLELSNQEGVEVTLLDRRNFHLFQPLLYQVATGGLSPANVCAPLRTVFQGKKNVKVLLAEVTGIDAKEQLVLLSDGPPIEYDALVVAAGASHSYFGNDQWSADAPGLKSIENAIQIRRTMLLAFERAERELDGPEARACLRFVIIGGGPTGVEMAGAIAEIANFTLQNEFRNINTRTSEIILVEGGNRLIQGYHPSLSAKAQVSLEALGVQVKLNSLVTNIDGHIVDVKNVQTNATESITSQTIIWAAGVEANSLSKIVAASTSSSLDRSGRVIVRADCTCGAYRNVYVLGDMAAHFGEKSNGTEGGKGGEEKRLPGVAQVAMQQGKFVGRTILQRLRESTAKDLVQEEVDVDDDDDDDDGDDDDDDENAPAFRYHDLGSMAVIGRSRAVADVAIPFTSKTVHLSGFLAWFAWLFIHLMYIVQFGNRLLVLIQWSWSYVAHGASARLITGGTLFPLLRSEDERNSPKKSPRNETATASPKATRTPKTRTTREAKKNR